MAPIIVATDFSPAALNALNYAADLALVISAPIVLLNVYQVPVSMNEDPMVLISVEDLADNSRNMLASLKQKIDHITSGKVDVVTESRLGEVDEEIASACAGHLPLLVIIGTTGHSGVEGGLFGSTALSVIGELKCPVLAVPRGVEYGKGIHTIGLAWDFTKNDQALPVEPIRKLVNTLKAHLQLLHVQTDLDDKPADTHPALLQSLASLNPAYHHIKHTDVAEGVSTFAEEHNFDLLITVPRKHGFFESLFRKSSTKDLVRSSHLPVLFVHE